MKLLIAIPALNEEDSIENIIQRCLAARKQIIAESPVTEVQVCVVSDGSTDRTVELASQYQSQIRLIVFSQNRGYGAAIKEAWKGSDADLLGFLDADGTCDPLFFANLSRALVEESADIALGCRLNKDTKMPLVRRIGNLIFATLLTAVAHARVRDTASGMRVLRHEAYRMLLPLPDGLHFTPSMSVRAMLGAGGGLKIIEIDMPYFERQGRSKLKVIKDGFRFLDTIFQAAFRYHPARVFRYLAGFCLVAAAVLFVMAAIQSHSARGLTVSGVLLLLLLGGVAGVGAILSTGLALLSRRMINIVFGAPGRNDSASSGKRVLSSPLYWFLPVLAFVLGLATLIPPYSSIRETASLITLWPGVVAAFFFFLIALGSILAWIVDYFLNVVESQLEHSRKQEVADRLERADLYVSR